MGFFGLDKTVIGIISVIVSFGFGGYVLAKLSAGINDSADAAAMIDSGIAALKDTLLPLFVTIATIVFVLLIWEIWQASSSGSGGA